MYFPSNLVWMKEMKWSAAAFLKLFIASIICPTSRFFFSFSFFFFFLPSKFWSTFQKYWLHAITLPLLLFLCLPLQHIQWLTFGIFFLKPNLFFQSNRNGTNFTPFISTNLWYQQYVTFHTRSWVPTFVIG